MMQKLAVIGDPVGHSLSPQIHMTWIDSMALEASYESIRVPTGETAAALEDFAYKTFRGLNVTLPHKQAVLSSVSHMSPAVIAIGAANTLTQSEPGQWSADNTDAPGLMAALKRVGVVSLEGKSVLLLGAGGAARAALFALDQAGADITLLNRTVEKAGKALSDCCARDHSFGPLDDLPRIAESADLVINSASLGHGGEFFALPKGEGRLFLEMSYGAPAGPQIDHARSQGWAAEDGLGMLVCQAAESFRIWFGGELPDVEIALEACRETLRLTE
ncbi:MAG: shikimate dehydrogenase [Henriciella sp.]|uniref:shikimate dehydrogenase family protein n=1 Tax=Henriciella sp. TaxID=1968823 RepID=UPI003C72356D